MTTWAIVPIKPLRRGKSRLSSLLDMESRIALNLCLLENTLATLKAVPEIEQVLVISRDPQALAAARSHQARTIQEAGSPHLNQALERATMFARRYAVHGVMIIPADLPLINTYDIQRILNLAVKPSMVIIAPDRHRMGTNALFVSPPGAIQYQFGHQSFHLHCQQALASGIPLEIIDILSISLDLDIPEDMELIRRQMQLLEMDQTNSILRPDKIKDMADVMDGVNPIDYPPCIEKLKTMEPGE